MNEKDLNYNLSKSYNYSGEKRYLMRKNLIKNILLILVPLIILSLIGISLVNIGIISTEPPKISTDEINTTLKINYGNNNIEEYNIKLTNATVYTVLIKASKDYNLLVEAEYYLQYQSHYVFSINSTKEGNNNKFWQYYINGKYGTIGVDLQPVKEGDIIEWKYQEPQI